LISELAAHLYRWCLVHEVTRRRGGTRLQTALTHLSPELQSYPLRVPDGTLYVDVATDRSNWLSYGLFKQPQTSYEPHVRRVLRALIRPQDTVVDVGANIGLHTLLISRLAKRVIAFEPNPKILPLLRRTLAELPNVELHECAAFDYSGTLKFYVSPDHCLGSIRGFRKQAVEISVPCKRLMDVLPDSVGLMKIDAEGAEEGIFRGAWPLLDRENAPILVYEDLHPQDSCLRPMLDKLSARYAHFIIRRSGEVSKLGDESTWSEMLAVPASRLLWTERQLAAAPPPPSGPAL
jgi:FkbM family methyltransferase